MRRRSPRVRWQVEAPVVVYVYARDPDEAIGRAIRVAVGRYWWARWLNEHRKVAVVSMGGFDVKRVSEDAR